VSLGSFVLLFVTGLCMAVANLLMKHGISQNGGFEVSFLGLRKLVQQPAIVAGFLLSGFAAIMWFRILSTQKVSTCYPLFVSLTYMLITLGAFYFFHETISVQKLVGLGIIVLGIVAVACG